MKSEGARPAKNAPAAANTDLVTVPRQAVKNGRLALEPRAYIVHGNCRAWLLLLVKCPCGSIHQHRTSHLNFGEGIRRGGCGRRYLLRVAAVKVGEAA